MTTSQVTCPCGALYERTEFNAAPRETDSFICTICGEILEVFAKTKAPSYRITPAVYFGGIATKLVCEGS